MGHIIDLFFNSETLKSIILHIFYPQLILVFMFIALHIFIACLFLFFSCPNVAIFMSFTLHCTALHSHISLSFIIFSVSNNSSQFILIIGDWKVIKMLGHMHGDMYISRSIMTILDQ